MNDIIEAAKELYRTQQGMKLDRKEESDRMFNALAQSDQDGWVRIAVRHRAKIVELEFHIDQQKRCIDAMIENGKRLESQRDKAYEALERIADTDHRGNRSSESIFAFHTLNRLRGTK